MKLKQFSRSMGDGNHQNFNLTNAKRIFQNRNRENMGYKDPILLEEQTNTQSGGSNAKDTLLS